MMDSVTHKIGSQGTCPMFQMLSHRGCFFTPPALESVLAEGASGNTETYACSGVRWGQTLRHGRRDAGWPGLCQNDALSEKGRESDADAAGRESS